MAASTSSGADQPVAASSVPKQILAFYYGWYGSPPTNKFWAHWSPVAGSTTQADNITDTPADGLYSSFDPAEAAKQVAEAQSAGITGFIASWWGVGNNTNKSLPVLLRAAERAGMKIAAMLEPNALSGSTPAELMASAEQDIEYLVKNYASSPSWLTVDGKPVIFIYGTTANELTADQWATVLRTANANTPNGIFIMGPNGTQWGSTFDSSFEYSVASAFKGKSVAQADAWASKHYASLVGSAHAAGQAITTSTVVPGFDNSNDASETLTVVPRASGELYAAEWKNAVAANPDWVLVSTWNEYHEGTEIEPTSQYGTSYLTQTGTYARQFLGPDYAVGQVTDGAVAKTGTGATGTSPQTAATSSDTTATLTKAQVTQGAAPGTGRNLPAGSVVLQGSHDQ